MKPELRNALFRRLVAQADDELILGHRNSEWCGHAPILEEDIAFANIALDEIGHAALWYGLAAELAGEDEERFPDELIYRRSASEFQCAQLVELPKGDWAFTITRQYLFDAAEKTILEKLLDSAHRPAAEVAEKVLKEEFYHHRHSRSWVLRLGLGTAESLRRMKAALDELWPYSLQLFIPQAGDRLLVEDGLYPDLLDAGETWRKSVVPFLAEAGLAPPPLDKPATFSRSEHSTYLQPMIEDLQSVSRSDPRAAW